MMRLLAQVEKPADTAAVVLTEPGATNIDLLTVSVTMAAIIVGAFILQAVLSGVLRRASRHRSGRLRWGAIAAAALGKPVTLGIWVIAAIFLIDLGIDLAHYFMPAQEGLVGLTGALRADVLPPARTLVIVLALTMFVAGFVRGLQAELETVLTEREGGGDVTAVQGLGSIAVIIVWLLGAMTALGGLGVDTTAVLAVVGLSSAGLAFAAKDLLGNFFGGIMLLFNRPFETGDWVVVKGVEGAIERIGLYATSIRAGDKRLIWIPNQTFTAAIVENPSRRTHRQLNETIGLRYSDLSKLGAITADILSLLQDTPAFDQGEACRVTFAGYGDSTVDISMVAFSTETGAGDFAQLRERIMLAVGKIVQKHGADFAYPTVTMDGASTSD
jgi:MscS family membrane protein